MKQIQVTVPAGTGWKIRDRLKEEKFPYVSLIDGRTGDLVLITLDSKLVEQALGILIDEGVSRKHGDIHVLDVTARLPIMATKARQGRRVSKEEIFEDMRSRAALDRSFMSYIILSAVIAAVGVIADNIVILIASMIVAPLMAPMVALSFAILMNNNKIFWSAIKTQAIGLTASVTIGFLIGAAVSPSSANDAMFRTSTISLFDLIVALVGGLAAGVATSERKQSEIVGIAVAASLMPPATNIGIQLWMAAWVNQSHLEIAIGSIILLTTNIIAIHGSCLVVYWFQKIRPRTEWAKKLSKSTVRRRIAVMTLLGLAAALPIMTASLTTYSSWTIESNSISIIEEKLGGIGISVSREQIVIEGDPSDPTVLVITIQAVNRTTYSDDRAIITGTLSNITTAIEDFLTSNIFASVRSWRKVDITLYLIDSSTYRI